MGACYLGVENFKGYWIKKQTEKWESDIFILRETAEKYTQESYATSELAV